MVELVVIHVNLYRVENHMMMIGILIILTITIQNFFKMYQQLAGMTTMTDSLLEASLDGPQQDAINNTAATVRAMSDLVDQALGRTSDSAKLKKSANESFDLRRSAARARDTAQASR